MFKMKEVGEKMVERGRREERVIRRRRRKNGGLNEREGW
jgi:hypothetical protein